MSTNRPRPRTSSAFEFFLYTAIIVETALAAFVYKIIFGDPDLARLSLYFGILYFAFLAWCIAQLNSLHRRRKLALAEPIGSRSLAPRLALSHPRASLRSGSNRETDTFGVWAHHRPIGDCGCGFCECCSDV